MQAVAVRGSAKANLSRLRRFPSVGEVTVCSLIAFRSLLRRGHDTSHTAAGKPWWATRVSQQNMIQRVSQCASSTNGGHNRLLIYKVPERQNRAEYIKYSGSNRRVSHL